MALKVGTAQLTWLTVLEKYHGWKEHENSSVRGYLRCQWEYSTPAHYLNNRLHPAAEVVTDMYAPIQVIKSLTVLGTSVL